jgi:hypothetical protein
MSVTGPLRPGVYQAIHDISIANELGTFAASANLQRPLSDKVTVIQGLLSLSR